MKNFARFCLICVVLCIFLSGCAANARQMVSNRLDPEMLNSKLETQTIDLSVDSKCGSLVIRVEDISIYFFNSRLLACKTIMLIFPNFGKGVSI